MHIAIILGPFLGIPPDPCGAVERIWLGLARQFVARGHKVTLLLRRLPGQSRREERDGMLLLRATRFRRTNHLPRDLPKDLLYSMRMASKAPRADILVTNSFFLPLVQRLQPFKRQNIYVAVQRFPKNQMKHYLHARRLAAASTAIRQAIVEQTPAAAAITRVIGNPIDTDLLIPPAKRRPSEGPKVLLFTGRVHPEKGLHVLAEAFARVAPDFGGLRLRIVGPWKIEQGGGGGEYVARVRKLAGGAPVEFVEPIFDLKLLAEELRGAHFYVYPSLAVTGEASPVAPLEAMACGLMPIVSNIPMFRDYLNEGETGFFFEQRGDHAVENLAAAIRRVASLSPQEYQRMSAAAAARARDFSYPIIAGDYLRDFEEILGSPRGDENTKSD